MSLICMSSNGQRPEHFTNVFPSSIVLGRDCEVQVAGYSGNLDGATTTTVFNINIVEGENNAFTVYHGQNAPGVGSENLIYQSFPVYLKPGAYSPDDLAAEVQVALNIYEYVDHYDWTCTHAAGIFTIKCGVRTAPATAGSDGFVCYYGDIINPGHIITAAGSNTLVPVVNPVANEQPCYSFVDVNPTYFGLTGEATGAAFGGVGTNVQFTYDGDIDEVAMSFGMVMEQNITKCTRKQTEYHLGGSYFGPSRNLPLDFSYSNWYNGNTDFVYATGSTTSPDPDVGFQICEKVGYFAFGINIRGSDGAIGLIKTRIAQVEGGGYKTMREIDYSAGFNITDSYPGGGAAQSKRFGWAIRSAAGAGNRPVVEFFYNDGLSGNQLIGAAGIELSGDYALFRATNQLHMGVHYDPEYINDETKQVRISQIPIGHAGLPADAQEPINIGFSPFSPASLNEDPQPLLFESDFISICNFANIRTVLGIIDQWTSVANTFNTGIVSQEAISTATSSGITEFSPIVITCPDLTAKGYIGAAAGGGQEAPILGIARIRGNTSEFGFSGDGGDNWIQLNNAMPITLQSLTIVLKDMTNKPYNNLAPNFCVWLRFKSNNNSIVPKGETTVGRFNYLNENNL